MNYDKSTNTFGHRLKTLREAKHPKWSQQYLGEKLGQTEQSAQPHVSKLEGNTIEPSITELKLISKMFNVSTDWLLGCDNLTNTPQIERTMYDVLIALFSLEDTNIRISRQAKDTIDLNPYTGEPFDITIITNYISFECAYLNDFLQDWEKTYSISKHDGEVYKAMYEAWKKEVLEKAKDYDIKGNRIYDFDDIPF